jgi:protocatechuate 3,4-dioxygenase beta subunit
VYGQDAVKHGDSDLTTNAGAGGEAIGERIIVVGRVLDEDGRPVPEALIELWQANAAGRYPHKADQHDAPQDPHFIGAGRCLADSKGEYRFVSIKPGPYPWSNHPNAWRPAHIHFSIFGQAFVTRLVTQMFFPGDPLLPLDPIYNGIPEARARQRLVAEFALDVSEPGWALGYRFDIVLRGAQEGPPGGSKGKAGHPGMLQSPSQTIGPYFAQGLLREGYNDIPQRLASEKTQGERIRVEGRVIDGAGRPVEDAMIEIWQANAYGRYHHPLDEQDRPLDLEFRGQGRSATDAEGRYWFETIKPGSVPGPDHTRQAPHINAIVFARGMLPHAFTRIYFEAEAANQDDPVLMRIEDAARRSTLIARRETSNGRAVYRFDIHLQGENETVFFDA